MKYCSKGHKDRNRHKNRIKRSGQARLVYVIDINHNIRTTWKWARGDTKEEEERKKERMEDRKKEWMICTLSFVAVDPDLLPLTPVLQIYARRIIWGEGLYLTFVCYLFVSWCFEPSQPVGIISGLKTNSIPSLSYSAHKSFNTNLVCCMVCIQGLRISCCLSVSFDPDKNLQCFSCGLVQQYLNLY